jgi:hypothetical protein
VLDAIRISKFPGRCEEGESGSKRELETPQRLSATGNLFGQSQLLFRELFDAFFECMGHDLRRGVDHAIDRRTRVQAPRIGRLHDQSGLSRSAFMRVGG